ncbi:MAG: RNA methyltransferase [Clostridia bacterium]|nr:RNA methyltransferase [Clostridia bacterium]
MEEIISSRQNPTVVRICKLSDKKHREAERLFRFDGVKLCAEAIMSGAELEFILLRREQSNAMRLRIAELSGKYPEDTGARVILLENSLFDAVSEEKSPEGVISVAKYIDKFHKIATIDNNCVASESRDGRIMLLEDIRDPGNLGTIMRSAAALGVETLVLCGECADIYSSKTLRGSMGALFRLKTVRARDGAAAVRTLRVNGRRVFAAALTSQAVSLPEAALTHEDCIVIGNEGHGLSGEIISECDGCVIIPMSAGTESLNAATAAAIFMWETRKKN